MSITRLFSAVDSDAAEQSETQPQAGADDEAVSQDGGDTE
jgi:hypothetical protein